MRYSYVRHDGSIVGAMFNRKTNKPAEPDPEPVPIGFTVSDMLNTPGVTWTHRGGSANFPEMSEYAYDQSIGLGYKVLEFSAQRTSDGWWFGLHDNSLVRTSPTAPDVAISNLTRSEVESYQNNGQPYYGLVDFLEKYSSEYVVVVDPKNSGGLVTEFLNLIDQYTDPSRAVIKFFGVGGGGAALSNQARARGYETWGFYYEADYLNGNVDIWQSNYTLLGMEHDAPTAWTGPNNILSYNKPVVAHILRTQEHYNQAISKGASMAQCANVVNISPVPS